MTRNEKMFFPSLRQAYPPPLAVQLELINYSSIFTFYTFDLGPHCACFSVYQSLVPSGTWDFFKMGWPPKKNWNKLNMKNIGTKSVNMSDIMVYLVMFSTTIDNILCFWVLIRWKLVIIFISLWYPLELGSFLIYWHKYVHNILTCRLCGKLRELTN